MTSISRALLATWKSRRERLIPVTGLLLVVALTLLIAGPARADTTTTSISGHVSLGDVGHPAGAGSVTVLYQYIDYSTFDGAPSVQTDANGDYVISGLMPGWYHLRFISHVAGYGSLDYTNYAFSDSHVGFGRVDAAIDQTGIDMVMPVPAAIFGTVYLDSGSHPVGAGDIQVSYRLPDGTGTFGSVLGTVVTDASGSYRIPGLTSGVYQLSFSYVGSASVIPPDPVAFAFAAGTDARVPSVAVFTKRSITGLVYLGTPASGQPWSSVLAGAGDARVSISYSSRPDGPFVDLPGSSAVTASDGTYTISGLVWSFYRLQTTWLGASGEYRSNEPTSEVLFYTDPVVTVNQYLTKLITVSGHVSLGVASRSAGAGDVQIGVYNGVSPTPASTSLTDAQGDFTVTGVPQGNWVIGYSYVGPGPEGYSPIYDNTSIAGGRSNVTGVTATLPLASASSTAMSFSGTVMAATNDAPLAGISVKAAEFDPTTGGLVRTFATTTDAQGRYIFLDLPVGVYGFEAHDTDQNYATMDYNNSSPYYQPDYIDPGGGLTSGVNFYLSRAAHITGTVTGPSTDIANGYVNAEVEVEDYSSGDAAWFETGDLWPVNPDGTFDVSDLPPDDYRLIFTDDADARYAPVTITTESLSGGQTSNVDVKMSRTIDGGLGSLPPVRLLDTRYGIGGHLGAVPPHGTVDLQVTKHGGVPDKGEVSAVVLNVTVAGSTGAGYITAYGDGPAPTASNLNFVPGQLVPNLVIVPVDDQGYVHLYNGSSGSTQLVADVAGYYLRGADAPAPGGFGATTPTRLLDTRSGLGAPVGAVDPHKHVKVHVTGQGVVPEGVKAVVLNVTVAGSTGAGYITAYSGVGAMPTASNLNFVPGQLVPNLVIAPVSPDGDVDLYNGSSGATQLVADVEGYFKPSATDADLGAGAFHSVAPSRLLDTRYGIGADEPGAIDPGGVLRLNVAGPGSALEGKPVSSVVLNVTDAGSTGAGYITAYPDGQARPTASNLNFVPGQLVPNLVVVPVDVDGYVDLYNGSSGSTQLVADVAGWFASPGPP